MPFFQMDNFSMTKFIFVTGGVISSLGKGICAASIAAILESRGLNVTIIKLDPYINVDPGTMSPFQHGEVFVTKDGAETDLDLGHYERFIHATMHKKNNFTTGQVYESVITKERYGAYLGKTVQVIPHITDEIKLKLHAGADNKEVAIVEIGGTVGDIESLPFLEAIRQMRIQLGRCHTLFIHLSYVPYLPSSGEIKTKPTQHSIKELRAIGIQPDMLICRMDRPLQESEQDKLSLFCDVDKKAIIACYEVDSIYKIPQMLHRQNIDTIICKHLQLHTRPADLSSWRKIIDAIDHPKHEVNIAMVGKYVELTESYKSLTEALTHAGIYTQTKVNIIYLDSEKIEKQGITFLQKELSKVNAVLIPGGFGTRGVEGKIATVTYAREHQLPFLGICLGMQIAVIEYAREKVGLKNANSTEFDARTPYPVIALVEEWMAKDGAIEKCHQNNQLGGTMRLGNQSCRLEKNSLAYKIYGQEVIEERHRHRYEVNNHFINKLIESGLVISGYSNDCKALVETIELSNHPWFFACQFHPEFNSNPREAHPLFIAFIKAALLHQQREINEAV